MLLGFTLTKSEVFLPQNHFSKPKISVMIAEPGMDIKIWYKYHKQVHGK